MPLFGQPILDASDGLNQGLVGFWPLTEDVGPWARDISPYRRSGPLINGRARIASLKGKAYTAVSPNELINFGGDTAVATGSDLGMTGKAGLMGVSLWVFNPSANGTGAFFKIGTNAGTGDGWGIGIGASDADTSGPNIIGLYSGIRWIATGVALGTGWHHLVMSLNASGYPTIFLDGVQIHTDTTGAPRALGNQGATFTTLNTDWGAGRYATASHQNVRVWRRAPTPEEVARLYADPWAGTVQRRRLVPDGGAAPITGEGAFTFADMTVAGVGTFAARTGGSSRTRRGARRIYLPEDQPTAVFHPNALPADLAAHAVPAWPDDDEDETWFLLA